MYGNMAYPYLYWTDRVRNQTYTLYISSKYRTIGKIKHIRLHQIIAFLYFSIIEAIHFESSVRIKIETIVFFCFQQDHTLNQSALKMKVVRILENN